MKIAQPAAKELAALVGAPNYALWKDLQAFLFSHYNTLKTEWHTGGKAGFYECKFRKNSKTVCSLFAREKGVGFMIIFGHAEREAFNGQRSLFPA